MIRADGGMGLNSRLQRRAASVNVQSRKKAGDVEKEIYERQATPRRTDIFGESGKGRARVRLLHDTRGRRELEAVARDCESLGFVILFIGRRTCFASVCKDVVPRSVPQGSALIRPLP